LGLAVGNGRLAPILLNTLSQELAIINTRSNPLAIKAGSLLPRAVIAGAYQTGVLGVRSLMRRGVKAMCFDCSPSYPGFQSVYGRAHLSPDPDTAPDAWLLFMLDLARRNDGPMVLIPSSDKFVSAIARHADALKHHYIFSPGIRLQGLLADKQTQYELAAKHAMPMPRTRFVDSLREVIEFAQEASFPCLIKPTHFREWRKFHPKHPLFGVKISIAASQDELYQQYELAAAVNSSVILQEIIQGKDTAKRVYLACYNAQGERIANAMFRELRCDPLNFGPASISEPVIDSATDKVCDRFLRSIGYQGICEIEMKWDSRDGQVKLIEANPRLSGGGDAAPYAGVDLCWIHYLDLIGRNVRPVTPVKNNFRHVVLRADAHAAPAYLRAGLITWRDILQSYRPPLAFYDLDIRDWRYSLETLLVCLRTILRNIFQRKP
jgi:predicted ATP-grasp superfamily ATP-dependent carboligase